jgi:hypothetical protein
MPRAAHTEPLNQKTRKTIVRQRKGPIDPRKLEEELAQAQRFLDKITADASKIHDTISEACLRIRQIKAMQDHWPRQDSLDIETKGE